MFNEFARESRASDSHCYRWLLGGGVFVAILKFPCWLTNGRFAIAAPLVNPMSLGLVNRRRVARIIFAASLRQWSSNLGRQHTLAKRRVLFESEWQQDSVGAGRRSVRLKRAGQKDSGERQSRCVGMFFVAVCKVPHVLIIKHCNCYPFGRSWASSKYANYSPRDVVWEPHWYNLRCNSEGYLSASEQEICNCGSWSLQGVAEIC